MKLLIPAVLALAVLPVQVDQGRPRIQWAAVLHHGARDVWYVLTLSENGETVARVE